MKPHALFIDIDRTLTAEYNVIPERNLTALKKAKDAGHKVIINTGRSYGNIPPNILEQIDTDGVISGNGTVVMCEGNILREDYIKDSAVEKIARICFECKNCWAVFEGFNHSYCITGRGREPASWDIKIASFEEFREKSKDDRFQVVAVGITFPESRLSELDDDITHYRFDHYFDLTAKGNNKADGMLMLLDKFGIPVERSIAFGDSDNDRTMLKTAGKGVAVANAQELLLKEADYITLSNTEGGVGAAIEELLLKGEQK
ncbi:MAG: HAD family phosphatase [Clostridia bacterium]|nr:HAD family phosphatase [Clostridia bacterium]